MLEEVELRDISEEGPQEEEAVQVILRRYSRALKLLFKKYASTIQKGRRHGNENTFDGIAARNASISESEFYKLLKE